MLQALKNLEAKEARPQTNRAAATAPASGSVVAKTTAVATAVADASSPSPIAPRIIEVVDTLDAVVGHELGGSAALLSSPAFAVMPNLALSDFASLGQPKNGASPVPTPAAESKRPETKTVPIVPVVKAACELERQVKRSLSNPIRSQPLVDLVDRLIRDMEQTESKTLAFVSMGVSDDSHLAILQAGMLLAEKRSKHVLLIDGDVSRRALSEGLEYGRCPGLSELCAGKAETASVCQATATKQLSFVPAGQTQPANDSAAEKSLTKALGQWNGEFDCILIDAGSAGSGFASALAQSSDAAYLVVELGAVETNTAQAALARLLAAGARVLGCIAT
jgi:Mrp family chromosome partitioning ATPase